MRARLAVFLILGVGSVFALILARELILSRGLPHEAFTDKKMRLLTYATLVSANGPGAELIREFEKDCSCKVEVTAVTDAGLMLERLKLAPFDAVVGLDQLMLSHAREQFEWRALEIENVDWAPVARDFADSQFVPFDWSPMSFVYRKDGRPVPARFDDLSRPEFRKQFALQDPRASSPGLQFYHWAEAVKGEGLLEFLRAFKDNVHSVSPSWSFAYGLFRKNQVRFVFSYLTSLAYHWGFDKDKSYQILSFPEGHPVQMEFAAVPSVCRQCELGAQFVQHLLQPESQKVIMEQNFMLPALKGVEQGTVFAELPKLKTLKISDGKDLNDWDQIFSR